MEDQNQKQQQKIKNSILSRVRALYIAFFILSICILVRILWIQFDTKSTQRKSQSIQYSFRSEVLEATRGNILSSDERLLATSIPYYEIRMDMKAKGLDSLYFIENVGALARKLAEYLKDKPATQYESELRRAMVKGDGYHRVTFKKVNFLELQDLKQFPIFSLGPNKGGFLAVEIGRRVQPHGALASRTIGFVNQDGKAVGIEGGFNEYLRGIDGITMMQKVSGSFWIPIASPLNIEPVNGMDIVTTLDIEIQDITQTALRNRLAEVEGTWGTVAVMEVATGHIKAIANATRLPNGQIVEDYNYAVGMSLEPGSTMKIATLITLLEDAKMTLSTMINTENGSKVVVGADRVTDTRSGGYGTISLEDVFIHSSNVGFAKAVYSKYASNPGRYSQALAHLGLDKELGLQIAGEARPQIKFPGKRGWDGMTLPKMAYGYALRITPLQILTLCNAVANNGKMIKPLFVKELRQYGQTIETYSAVELIPQIASLKTIADVQRAMMGVVDRGTGKSLKSSMYSVAAKTGTAQIALDNRGYMDNGGRHYLGSVVGYFPADKPRYSIVIAIRTYHRAGSSLPYYGGALAAPLFKTIADNIFTKSSDFQAPLIPVNQPISTALTASISTPSQLKSTLDQLHLSGYQIPPQATSVKLDSGRIVPIEPLIGSIKGMTLADAVTILESKGYTVEALGRGRVVEQQLDSITNVIRLILK